MLQAVFVAAHAFVIFRLIRSRLFHTFPDFLAYLSISLAIGALPRHPESSAWWHSWFVIQQLTLLAALLMVIREAFEVATLEFLPSEHRAFRIALWGALLAAIGAAWRMDPSWSWFHHFTAGRQCLQFGLFLAVAVGAGYLWHRGIPLTRHTGRHLLCLCWLLAASTLSRVLDPNVGLLSAAGSRIGWQALNLAAYLNLSLCFLAWGFAFTRPSEPLVARRFVRAFRSGSPAASPPVPTPTPRA